MSSENVLKENNEGLASAISQLATRSIGWMSSPIADQWQANLQHYLSWPMKGDDKLVGTSKHIVPVVQERVDWATAQLTRVIDGQKQVVVFEPNTNSDIDKLAAQQQNRVVNHVLRDKSSHSTLINGWAWNGFLYGLGVVNVDFSSTTKETKAKTIEAVTDEQLVELVEAEKRKEIIIEERTDDYQQELPAEISSQLEAMSPEIVAEAKKLLPIVRDLKVRKIVSKPEFTFTVIAVEDFIVTNDAQFDPNTGGIKATMQGHRRYVARPDLIEEGYSPNLVNELPKASDRTYGVSTVRSAAVAFNGGVENYGDKVEVYEIYTKIAIEGKKRRNYHITVGGDFYSNPVILGYEEVSDMYPYAPFVPWPISNTLFGQGIGDRAGKDQDLITKITRGIVNNLHYTVDPIKVVNPDETVVDDTLNIHPGKVIRSSNPTGGISYTAPPFAAASAIPVIDMIQQRLDHITGVGGSMVSIDATDLADVTATAAKQRETAQQLLIENVCRLFAESGYKYLAKCIIDQCINKPDLASVYLQKLSETNEPFVIDDTWDAGMDVSATVDFGMMSRDYKVQALQSLIAMQKEGLGTIATKENLFNSVEQYAETLGFRDVHSLLTPNLPDPPPPPDPNAGLVQIEQVKAAYRREEATAKNTTEQNNMRAEDDRLRDFKLMDFCSDLIKAGYPIDLQWMMEQIERPRKDIDWVQLDNLAAQKRIKDQEQAEAQQAQQEQAAQQMVQQQMMQNQMPPQQPGM
ncbi:hypothetical protein [Agrobacterium pusense]|uniref:portal protein n=1 Tax=Agrobacterium pusense TaxID=648995 RepID=UPI0022B8A083|nr:hypothetical protein [Agrobacterium pusense]MCZ7926191.1 hypothetical protein [Agrobacterium pusense]